MLISEGLVGYHQCFITEASLEHPLSVIVCKVGPTVPFVGVILQDYAVVGAWPNPLLP